MLTVYELDCVYDANQCSITSVWHIPLSYDIIRILRHSTNSTSILTLRYKLSHNYVCCVYDSVYDMLPAVNNTNHTAEIPPHVCLSTSSDDQRLSALPVCEDALCIKSGVLGVPLKCCYQHVMLQAWSGQLVP